ncbi:MAG TPA: murein biosynthesis integral membrane protein MurJ [Pyrinomonadaceae bacterium]|nr:murein biosynthesis integral membrane protein MurJ [Pyrinomonadaceae bacterium]
MNDPSQPDSPKAPPAEDSSAATPELSVTAHDEAGSIAGETVAQPGTAGPPESKTTAATATRSSGKSAVLVGSGILFSRIIGLVRQRVFAHYFGTSAAGDAFAAAFKIPNFLQNVFGEGALSASFIPIYSKLLAQDNEKEASHVARAILGLLALITSVVVLFGVLAAPFLIDAIAPGFEAERRELTIRIVQILFPGAGLLVLSAWCLGILNSHHRFFISYSAPVVWNLAIITSLILFGGQVTDFRLAEIMAFGAVVGSALQFAVQLPTVFKLVDRIWPTIDVANTHVRQVVRNFFPVFMSRGVIQISAFVDEIIASFLPYGAIVALTYSQSLYTLPVSLFGMSVSAAELPAMSRALGTIEQVAGILRKRLDAGLQRIAFFIVPSATAFFAMGDVMVGALYQSGRFQGDAKIYVWGILAGSSVGLLASTLGRLYSSTYYALKDTRTPLLYAVIHVLLAIVLGYLFALPLPRYFGIAPKWGVVGLTLSASIAASIEYLLLRRTLNRRIGRTGLPFAYLLKLWAAAFVSAGVGWALKLSLGSLHPIPLAAVVLGCYGVTYFGLTYVAGIAESRAVIGRILRILKIAR